MFSSSSRIIPLSKQAATVLRSAAKIRQPVVHSKAEVISKIVAHARCLSRASAEPFINGTSGTYVEDMYESWKEDPTSVHKVCTKFCLFILVCDVTNVFFTYEILNI